MKHALLCLILALPVFSFAQSNFQKGYILVNSNDTLKGYIDFKEHESNPKLVKYKSATDSKVQVFTVKNCTAYQIDGVETYQRAVVDISTANVNINYLSIGADSSVKRDTVFLKVLQAGENVTLYAYRDNIKIRFYLKEADSHTPYELVKMLFLDQAHEKTVITADKYKGQLLQVMNKYHAGTEAQRQKLRFLEYNKESLIKISALINHQGLTHQASLRSRFFAGIGLTASKLNYQDGNEFEGTKSNVSYLPSLTAGVDFLVNPAIGKLIIRLELSFFMNKNDVSSATGLAYQPFHKQSIDQYTVALNPQVVYNIYNTNPLKVFVGAGVGLNYATYSNNKYFATDAFGGQIEVNNFTPFQTFGLSFPFRAGVVINKKIECAVAYTMPYTISNYAIKLQRIGLGVNYIFGRL